MRTIVEQISGFLYGAMIPPMSKSCPNCLWVSSNDAEVCERCGASFDDQSEPEPTGMSLGDKVKTGIGVLALIILGIVIFQRLGLKPISFNWVDGARAGLQGAYLWLLGPNEVLKPFIIIMLALPLAILFVLWLLARLQ
jgi:hypothetical protein